MRSDLRVVFDTNTLISAFLIHNADLVEVDVTITDCRDPKDNKFLELAVSGQATHLADLSPLDRMCQHNSLIFGPQTPKVCTTFRLLVLP